MIENAAKPGPVVAPGGEQVSGWRSQFACPRGWQGSLVGRLMARKNAGINHLAVELLDPGREDRVLEVGFGPGVALREIAMRCQRGLVAGVDRSELMRRQASERLLGVLTAERSDLRVGSVEALPWREDSFDKAMAVNVFHHIPAVHAGLAELRRVIRPGGLLLLGVRLPPKRPGRFQAPGLTEEQIADAGRALETSGFEDVQVERRSIGREVAFLLGS